MIKVITRHIMKYKRVSTINKTFLYFSDISSEVKQSVKSVNIVILFDFHFSPFRVRTNKGQSDNSYIDISINLNLKRNEY